jgi:hypothetical protein
MNSCCSWDCSPGPCSDRGTQSPYCSHRFPLGRFLLTKCVPCFGDSRSFRDILDKFSRINYNLRINKFTLVTMREILHGPTVLQMLKKAEHLRLWKT